MVRRLAAGILVLIFLAEASALRAEMIVNGVIVTRSKAFVIPISVGASERAIKQVRVFVSQDLGKTWEHIGTVDVVESDWRHVRFEAARDGLYWFASQWIDTKGAKEPQDEKSFSGAIRIRVDTEGRYGSTDSNTAEQREIAKDEEVEMFDRQNLEARLCHYRRPTVTRIIRPSRLFRR